MNMMKKLGMAACVCFLITILNIFPVEQIAGPVTAEAASVSVTNSSLNQVRKGGWTTIKVKSSSKIESVTATASNRRAKTKVVKKTSTFYRVSVKGLSAGSTTIRIKVKFKNGSTAKKNVSLTVFNVDRYNFIYKLLRKEGFSKNESLGIMANLLWETGPVNVYNRGSFTLATLSRQFVNPSDHTGSYYGMFQLEGSRKANMKSWCKRNGYLYSSVRGQIKFMAYEMRTSETKARRMLKSADSAYEAGVMFASYYERCATRYRAPRGTTAARLDLFY